VKIAMRDKVSDLLPRISALAGTLAALLVLFFAVVRPWYLSWRADEPLQRAALPGPRRQGFDVHLTKPVDRRLIRLRLITLVRRLAQYRLVTSMGATLHLRSPRRVL
jgi:hypothetical protein